MPFKQIGLWLAAHPRWTLTLWVGAALGPLLAKPFNIDDPLFVWLANQVLARPAAPFDFSVNWYGFVLPLWAFTGNPPGAGYFFAAAGGLFGWSEIGLHFAGLLAALAVILGTHRLAARWCAQPLLAAGVVLCMPVFLVSASTVMCDVLMLACWVWAVVFWVEGLERDSASKIFAAGLLVALALLTKYFGVALVPLLAVYGGMHQRKFGAWVFALLLPVAALGGYEWLTRLRSFRASPRELWSFQTGLRSDRPVVHGRWRGGHALFSPLVVARADAGGGFGCHRPGRRRALPRRGAAQIPVAARRRATGGGRAVPALDGGRRFGVVAGNGRFAASARTAGLAAGVMADGDLPLHRVWQLDH